ncbi:MAG: hypothetical protein DRJ98_04240 [Thermoprotei archaeon]|nr:MAG: hypothetical protein DRJ98_04240 [Thermoprotei archaeon]
MSGVEDLRAAILRVENLLERIRVEYYRDVAERMFYLESEILNLRREFRRLNEALETLASQLRPGRAEVTGLRDLTAPLSLEERPPRAPVSTTAMPTPVVAERPRPQRRRATRPVKPSVSERVELTREGVLKFLTTEANDTELGILRILYENPDYGSRGSTEIARAIGKVREHTARTLKKLCERGLLVREEGGIPFTYSLPREVAEALKVYLEGRRS